MNITKTKKIMHDGNWVEMQDPNGVSIESNGNKITFFYDSVKSLSELDSIISKEKFETVKNNLEVTKDSYSETHSSKTGLRVGFIDELNVINIFSYGEKQPGRYQVVLEGQIYIQYD